MKLVKLVKFLLDEVSKQLSCLNQSSSDWCSHMLECFTFIVSGIWKKKNHTLKQHEMSFIELAGIQYL